jgi:hypothetical protein
MTRTLTYEWVERVLLALPEGEALTRFGVPVFRIDGRSWRIGGDDATPALLLASIDRLARLAGYKARAEGQPSC